MGRIYNISDLYKVFYFKRGFTEKKLTFLSTNRTICTVAKTKKISGIFG